MTNKRQRIFFTCILPEQLIAKHGLSFAACNFSFNLMSGGGFDKVYSTMPLYVGGEMDKEAFEDGRFELVYDKLRKKGGIWQRLAALKEQWTIFRKVPKGASIWFYNLNTLSSTLFLLLKLFKPSVKLNVIALDLNPLDRLDMMHLKLLNTSDGVISLANTPLYKVKNIKVLPGVVPSTDDLLPVIDPPSPSFLLSGSLKEAITQLSMVLDAFSQMPEMELHITGSIEDDTLIKQYSEKYSNIVYYGSLPFKGYLDLLHKVTFCLSTRMPDQPQNECNFPSKIIESLLHNRVVVSTIAYPQLGDVKYFNVSSEKDAFIKTVRSIVSKPVEELSMYYNQSELVKEMFSANVWNTTMSEIEKN